jgi:hypothetical protein
MKRHDKNNNRALCGSMLLTKIKLMYYIIEEKNQKHKVLEVEGANDGTYSELQQKGFEVRGQFGSIDYANHWRDYYNGKITKSEHRKWLGL